MQINTHKIKSWRKQRGWTQQQLADICDVNLRTIQRIESTGSASAESISALASAFEIDRDEIFVVPRATPQQLRPVRPLQLYGLVISAMLIGALLGALSMYLVSKLLPH